MTTSMPHPSETCIAIVELNYLQNYAVFVLCYINQTQFFSSFIDISLVLSQYLL